MACQRTVVQLLQIFFVFKIILFHYFILVNIGGRDKFQRIDLWCEAGILEEIINQDSYVQFRANFQVISELFGNFIICVILY